MRYVRKGNGLGSIGRFAAEQETKMRIIAEIAVERKRREADENQTSGYGMHILGAIVLMPCVAITIGWLTGHLG